MSDQVLVTGISGFIAKHVALALLNKGYAVRGTLRFPAREDEVRAAMTSHGADADRLSFTQADLSSDDGWETATAGCRYVQHVASPFPMAQPRDRNALVPEARQGALRVVEAAHRAGAERVVMTSSMVAMMYRKDRPRFLQVQENDWTDPDWTATSAYIVSKTRAERAAWEWADSHGWTEHLTVVNPGMVLGPSLDGVTGTSVDVIKLMLDGTYPAVPPVSYPVVDVRDLAELHVAAMTAADSGGRRLIGAGESLSMLEMSDIIRDAFPQNAKKVPRRTLPAFLVRLLSVFDPALKSVVADLGVSPVAEAQYVTNLTGVKFRPSREAVIDAAGSIIERRA